MKRYILYALAILLIVIIAFLSYLSFLLPNVGPAPDLTVEITPERVARGDYLANHVMLCMDCHAQRDFTIYAGPPKPGTEGAGGEAFDQSMGFPGVFFSRNITPSGIGDWTDGELFRAITTGVSKDGSALFPVMPYLLYGQLDEEDIISVIAYIRQLKPVESPNIPSKPDFPFNFIINTIPKKANLSKRPDPTDQIAYGKYLITAASCGECHTNQKDGKVIGEPYAGGFEFQFPHGPIVRSSNITPHETGLASWTKEQFVQRFKMHVDSNYVAPNVGRDDFQTVMPWLMYAGMKDEDLEAIYAYLRTVAPVDNFVERYTD
ncbi:MAG TPA: c-type cytochrome [Saprospiraceae bacterium]|nr:c-type cytochrome [Saprospiraceae bacterium]